MDNLRIVNCKGCGRLIQQLDRTRLCAECKKALEEKYLKVRDFIREHKGTSIVEVSRENEVSIEQIKQWIREERIELNSAGDPDFCCLSCGTPIKSGKYCAHCKNAIQNQLKGVYVQPSNDREGIKHNGEKMRFLQK